MDRLPTRRDLKVLLSAPMPDGSRLSARQIDAFLRDGHKALIGATEAENAELRERTVAVAGILNTN
jgi:hypothetical protein